MERSLKHLFCKACALQFDNTTVFNLHLKLMHGKNEINVKKEKDEVQMQDLHKTRQNQENFWANDNTGNDSSGFKNDNRGSNTSNLVPEAELKLHPTGLQTIGLPNSNQVPTNDSQPRLRSFLANSTSTASFQKTPSASSKYNSLSNENLHCDKTLQSQKYLVENPAHSSSNSSFANESQLDTSTDVEVTFIKKSLSNTLGKNFSVTSK